MGLTRTQLGCLIKRSDVRNSENLYGIDAVRGMSIEKRFIPTKANMDGVSLTPYKLVIPNSFSYVPVTSRNGERITLAHNNTENTYLVSSSYEVFRVSDETSLDSGYLFMFFNRPEFDRYSRFNSWGSARESFSWEGLCDTTIELPPIDIQRRYVAIYESMLANQRVYEGGLDNLKLTLDASLDCCKYTSQTLSLGDLLKETDVRNAEGRTDMPMGLTLSQDFQPSKANLNNPFNYKIVEDGSIAANLIQIGRDAAYPIALNETGHALLVSPDYKVFEPLNRDIARFLTAWFGRAETGRFGWFICDDGVRGRLNVDKFLELRVPIPDEKRLHAVAELWSAYGKRRSINNHLKAQLKGICPILIRGSIEEASR